MKLILNCYYENDTKSSVFLAILKDERIYFGINDEDELPVFAYAQLATGSKQILNILEYRISNMLKYETDEDFNAQFKVQYFHKIVWVYTKLNWFQKQRLKLKLEDHFIQRDGNFKWLLGGIIGAIFSVSVTYYFTNQTKEVERLNKQNIELKDSIKYLRKLSK